MTKVLAVSAVREVMGTEHSLLNVTPPLMLQGVEVMLAAQSGGAFEQRWDELRLPFYALKLPERQGFRPNDGNGYNGISELVRLPMLTLRAIAAIARVIRLSKPDVIHSNCLITHFDCAVAGRITRAMSVLELHDIVAPGVGRLFMGLAVRLSGRAIAVSAAVRDQLPRWARDKVVVIPQSVNIERFDRAADECGQWRRRLSVSEDTFLVAAIGRVDPEKGLHVLIRAAARLRATGVDMHLVLVGSPSKDNGEYLAELTELADELIGDAVHFVPHVSDVAEVLKAVDVLACPSMEEPFGLILLEAQACGVPVVASASGGPLEFITHAETGMLVAPGNEVALADALGELLADPGLRNRMALAGRASVRTHYTAQIRAERFAALYRDLVPK